MPDKVFGQDFTNITSPTGAETVSVLQSGALKDVTLSNVVSGVTNNATSKSTPVDADELPLVDSAASNVLKKLTWANLKSSLVSYFNSVHDGWILDTNTWSYSSADSPTFVISVNADMTAKLSAGMRIKLTQTTVKYFMVTAVGAFSGGVTLVTVYGGTDYTLANAAITSPYYSTAETPVGFPASTDKWTVTTTDTSQRTQSTPTQYTWYNLNSNSIVVPIGAWRVTYEVEVGITINATPADGGMAATLSTANNTPDSTFTEVWLFPNVSGTFTYRKRFGRDALVTLAAKSTRYLNVTCNWSGATTLDEYGNSLTTKITAESLYL